MLAFDTILIHKFSRWVGYASNDSTRLNEFIVYHYHRLGLKTTSAFRLLGLALSCLERRLFTFLRITSVSLMVRLTTIARTTES